MYSKDACVPFYPIKGNIYTSSLILVPADSETINEAKIC